MFNVSKAFFSFNSWKIVVTIYDLILTFQRFVVLEIMCVDDEGTPIGGALVFSDNLDANMTTEASGVATFTLAEELVPGEAFLVTCSADRHADETAFVEVGLAPTYRATIYQQVGCCAKPCQLHISTHSLNIFQRFVMLEVTCLDDGDSPISGATVTGSSLTNVLTTDDLGEATFTLVLEENLLPGDVLQVECSAANHVNGVELVEIGQAPTTTVSVNQQVN